MKYLAGAGHGGLTWHDKASRVFLQTRAQENKLLIISLLCPPPDVHNGERSRKEFMTLDIEHL